MDVVVVVYQMLFHQYHSVAMEISMYEKEKNVMMET